LKEMAPEDAVTIIGEAKLATRYVTALAQSGVEATRLDGEDCAIAGLRLLDDD
jgi:2-dehydro-3-deoxygalactonokinase